MFDEELSSLMPGLETNRLVLFCLVGKWVRVFDEERSKAKNLLKIKKSVVSCAPEDQGSSDQIALKKEVDTRQHWILVSIWCREPKQPISKNFPKYSLRDKFRQILFLYWGYLESGKTRSGIDISGIEHRRKIYTFDDFKFLITLYYTSRTSSKRNSANSFEWTYNFYPRWFSKRSKSVNLLFIYHKFV